MKQFLFLVLFGAAALMNAQTEVQKTFAFSPSYDAGLKILPSGDGYVVFGNQRQSLTDTRRDAFLLQLNREGVQTGYTVYGSPTASEGSSEGMGIAATSDGWILASNKTESIIGSVAQAWLLRIGTGGAVMWSRTIPFSGLNNIVLADVSPVPGGGFVACGFGVIGSGRQLIAVKVADDGTLLWSKRYGPGAGIGLYVGPSSLYTYIAGGNKVMKIRTDTGEPIWDKTLTPPKYGATTGTVGIDLNDIVPTEKGEFAVVGQISNDDVLEYNSAYYTAVWNENGNLRWERITHSSALTGFSPNEATSAQYLPNARELLVGGTFDGHLLFARMDLEGRETDNLTVKANGEFFSPCLIKAGQFYAATAGVLTNGADVNVFFFRSAGNALALVASGGGNTTPQATLVPEGLRLYPNPAVDRATVDLEVATGGNTRIRLTDINGRVVWETTALLYAGANRVDIGLEQLNPGIYWLHAGENTRMLLKRE